MLSILSLLSFAVIAACSDVTIEFKLSIKPPTDRMSKTVNFYVLKNSSLGYCHIKETVMTFMSDTGNDVSLFSNHTINVNSDLIESSKGFYLYWTAFWTIPPSMPPDGAGDANHIDATLIVSNVSVSYGPSKSEIPCNGELKHIRSNSNSSTASPLLSGVLSPEIMIHSDCKVMISNESTCSSQSLNLCDYISSLTSTLPDPASCSNISVISTYSALTSIVSDSLSPFSSFYNYSSSHLIHSPSVTSTFFTSSMPPSPSSIISSSSYPTHAPSLTFYSSATTVSSFSLLSPTISPSPLLCPAENQWPDTGAGQNATGTCHKGTFNATRHCNDSGEWSEVNCITSEEFEAILSLSSSPANALAALLKQEEMPATQRVVLLDIIVSSNSNETFTEEFAMTLLVNVDQILADVTGFDDETRQSIGSQLLLTLDSYALNWTQNVTTSSDTIALNAQRILSLSASSLTGIDYNGNTIVLPSDALTKRELPFTAASYVYTNLSSVLSSTNNRTQLISPVVSSALSCNDSNCAITNLSEPVAMSFNLSHQTVPNGYELSCLFWNIVESKNEQLPSGYWSRDGCKLSSDFDGQRVSCQCNHLTHFAILLSPKSISEPESVHNEILTIIGQILVPISLLCMLLIILTYSCMRSLWNMRNYIHIMLCSNLFVAQLLFVIGIEQTRYQSVCSAIAVVLQYMFLVTFMWMLMEGVVLYVTLVKVFIKNPTRYVAAFTIISYGVPIVYMAIVVPIGFLVGTSDHNHYLFYVNNELIACWLDYESGFIWTFIAPVILIILANIGFFIMAIVIMKRHQDRRLSKTKTTHTQAKHWIKASLSLTIVMGIAWIGNILFFSRHLLFIAYIMTIFIAGQGIIIFILYVPLSKHVRDAYKVWWNKNTASLRSISVSTHSTTVTKEVRIKPTENIYIDSESVKGKDGIYSQINDSTL